MQILVTKRSALIIAVIGSFLFPLLGSGVNIALPSIGEDYNMDAVTLSWVATSFLLSAAVFLVPFGRLADIYGRKKIFTIGMIISSIASLFSAVALTGVQLITARVIHGVGSAMIYGTGIAILVSVYPPKERGKAIGVTVAATYLGLSVGPFLGGFLVQQIGWRSIFWINVPPGIFVIALIFWKLKGEWAEAKGEKFDIIGSTLYGISLISIMYGFTLLPILLGFWVIAGGVAGLVAFVVWELKQEHPILNMKLFAINRIFAFSNLAALINYSATFGVTFMMSLYLQYIKGFSPQEAGTLLMAQPIMMTIVSPIAGKISDRVEPRIVATIGMTITTIALSMFTLVGDATSYAYLICTLIVMGTGFGIFSSPNTSAVMGSVSKKYYGVASGTIGTMRTIGQMFSMGIATLVFSVLIGRVEITPEHYSNFLKSLRINFIIFAILCFIGIFASLARGKTNR
ncbi:MFS transporter [candidate division KSB1 bacterium]|nr:MFS transporter [candidate division KSB1 bacterium]